VVSSVLMNLCTHCYLGTSLQASSQLCMWSFGHLQPVYLTSKLPTCVESYTVIRVRHFVQFVMFPLCVPHHFSSVDFMASSIANGLYYVGTLVSNFDKKFFKGFIPSNVRRLLIVVPIQRTSLVSLAHILVDTSYI
jgi:hypothetical protein